MKTILILLLAFTSLTSFAQKKETVAPVLKPSSKDSTEVAIVKLDATDLALFADYTKKLGDKSISVYEYEKVTALNQQLYETILRKNNPVIDKNKVLKLEPEGNTFRLTLLKK